MNVIIPPKIIALLRNGMAVTVGIPLCYALGADGGYLYGAYLAWFLPFFLLWLVMIATKWEIGIGFFLVTIAWVHYAMTDHTRGWRPVHEWLLDDIAIWAISLVFSLFGTVPVYLWRLFRRRNEIQQTKMCGLRRQGGNTALSEPEKPLPPTR